jgi:hypothetical protein
MIEEALKRQGESLGHRAARSAGPGDVLVVGVAKDQEFAPFPKGLP